MVVFLSLAGCVSDKRVDTSSQNEEHVVLRKIAVVPFQNIIPDDPSITHIRCPVSGIYFSTAPYAGSPEKAIETLFLQKLATDENVVVMPLDRVKGAYTRIRAGTFKAEPQEVLKRVGEEVKADGVLVGFVYRYRARKGYRYSVEQPASVAFGVHLLRVSDGVFVWKGIFDKTQASLMENVLDVTTFLKGRGMWLTAHQLSEAGVEKILETFPRQEKD